MAASQGHEPNHAMRIGVIWFILSAIAVPLIIFVAGPHLPPGQMSDAALGQQFDNMVLTAVAAPVVLFVWTYFIYAMLVFRQPKNSSTLVDGPPLHGHIGIQVGWLVVTGTIVLSMAAFGTYELVVPYGAGSGEGPHAIWAPPGKKLQIQVIAQQWMFTYRYPSYGGFETQTLMIPRNTEVQFNVTSLDVIHDFWAYQLGVKADANPGINNIAFAKATQLGKVTVRCDELCGIWHGAMYNYGHVVTRSQFKTWALGQEKVLAPETKLLPRYSLAYFPSLHGAGGGYYASVTPAG